MTTSLSRASLRIRWLLLVYFLLVVHLQVQDGMIAHAFDTDLDRIGRLSNNFGFGPEFLPDPNGYLFYCPCMGRFGNKAEHFIGSLAFAKTINRTLVLHPWHNSYTKRNVPFDEWFQMDVLLTYHRVIPADVFMSKIAPVIWPAGERIGFCMQHNGKPTECEMKNGSPFGPFWDSVGVDFDKTEFFTWDYSDADLWQKRLPASEYPVLALRGAPASFPSRPAHRRLHTYLHWTSEMVSEATKALHEAARKPKYIAIHLRNGGDWERACEIGAGRSSFMAFYQCADRLEEPVVTSAMCFPDISEIIRKLRQVVEETRITTIVVMTDQRPMIREIEVALREFDVRAIHLDPVIPQYDLIMAARATRFIGNCVSSFTAFVKRERDYVTKLPTEFFGVD